MTWDKYKTNRKMRDLKPTISIIRSDMSGLNNLLKM